MAKTTKQIKIEQLESELKMANIQIERMKKDAEESFLNSTTYKQMQQELKLLRLSEEIRQIHLENEIRLSKRELRDAREALADNKKLCKRHNVEYWIGIANKDRFTVSRIKELETENEKLAAKVKAQEITIKHLKNVLMENDETEKPAKKKMGRAPIPDETKKRIRKYRRNGYKIKEIAEMEGLSVGAVSKICNGIKVKTEE